MTKVRAWILCVTVCSGFGPAAGAVELRNVLTDYTIASWSQKDGLPPGPVYSLAQDADGYLWVGTGAGLFRFDGMRFTQWDAPGAAEIGQAPIRAISVSRTGSLWIGFGGPGGVSRVQDGSVRNYDQSDGLPRAAVVALVEDQDGVIWMATNAGLFSLVDDRWQKLPPKYGLPDGAVYSAHVDKYGNLLVGAEDGVFRRGADGKVFELIETRVPGAGRSATRR